MNECFPINKCIEPDKMYGVHGEYVHWWEHWSCLEFDALDRKKN